MRNLLRDYVKHVQRFPTRAKNVSVHATPTPYSVRVRSQGVQTPVVIENCLCSTDQILIPRAFTPESSRYVTGTVQSGAPDRQLAPYSREIDSQKSTHNRTAIHYPVSDEETSLSLNSPLAGRTPLNARNHSIWRPPRPHAPALPRQQGLQCRDIKHVGVGIGSVDDLLVNGGSAHESSRAILSRQPPPPIWASPRRRHTPHQSRDSPNKADSEPKSPAASSRTHGVRKNTPWFIKRDHIRNSQRGRNGAGEWKSHPKASVNPQLDNRQSERKPHNRSIRKGLDCGVWLPARHSKSHHKIARERLQGRKSLPAVDMDQLLENLRNAKHASRNRIYLDVFSNNTIRY